MSKDDKELSPDEIEERARQRLAFATTLPGGHKAAELQEPDDLSQTLPGSKRAALAQADTVRVPVPVKPAAAAAQRPIVQSGDVITSTVPEGDSAPTSAPDGGIVSHSERERLTENDARDILDRRFRAAGMAIENDFTFEAADLLVVLDGYDPERKVGYAYLSHSDADVVTDFDEAAEVAFQHMAAEGTHYVLVVHDSDIPTADALERRIDAFFDQRHRASQKTERA